MTRQSTQCRTFVALGDSITYGTGATDDYGWAYLLRDWLQANGSPAATLYNYGTGSQMASGGENRLQEIASRFSNIDLMTVAYGMNDMPAEPITMSLEDFEASLTNIVETLKPISKRLCLLTITPNIIGGTTPGEDDYNAVITAVAAEQEVTLIDVSTAFPNTNDYRPDGVHPNDVGHAAIASVAGGYMLDLWRKHASARSARA